MGGPSIYQPRFVGTCERILSGILELSTNVVEGVALGLL